ncbi:MAG: AAA family ATPase [Phycisphaerae bacterium]|nr:AAA family ATPase [Phycisphaerae bacterium]
MRIAALHIDGFGLFRDESLTGLPAGLVLMQGDNEAGKSTLLGFIRAILFGFPDKRSREPGYPPLAGGEHGGRLVVMANNGEEFTIERRAGKRGGKLGVTDARGDDGGEELLRRLLAGTTRELFRNIYAFSLAELQTIRTLKADRVKAALYGASAGTALLALPQAMTAIDNRLDELFKPRGQTQIINLKLAELEQIRTRLREVLQGVSTYDQLCAKREQVGEIIQNVQSKLARLRAEDARLKAYLQLWSEWIELQERTAALQDLPAVVTDFPEQGLTRLQTETTRLDHHRQRLAELEESLEKASQEADGLTVEQRILTQSEAITVLADGRSQYVTLRADTPLKVQKRQALDGEIRELLRRLGLHWTEEKVLGLDRALSTREAIRQNETQLVSAHAEVTRVEQDKRSKQESYEAAVREEAAAVQRLKELGERDEVADERVVLDLHTGRDRFASVVADLPRVEADLKRTRERIKGAVKEIDPRWQRADVERFDTSVSAQQKVQEFAARLEKAEQETNETRLRRQSVEETLKTARQRHSEATRALEQALSPAVATKEELDSRRATLSSLQTALQKRDRLALELGHREERLTDKRRELSRLGEPPIRLPQWLRWLWLVFVLLALCAFGVGYLADQWLAGTILAGVLVLLSLGSVVLPRLPRIQANAPGQAQPSHQTVIEKEIAILERDREQRSAGFSELDEKIVHAAAELALPASPTIEDADAAEESLAADRRVIEQCERLQADVDKNVAEVRRLEKSLADLQSDAESRARSLTDIRKEWQAFAGGLGLDSEITPATVKLVFTKAEAVREQIRELGNLEQRVRTMKESREGYFALGNQVPSLTPYSAGSAADFLSEVDKFFERHKQRQALEQERELAERTLAEKRKQQHVTRKRSDEARASHEEAVEQYEKTLNAWRGWLAERGLDAGLSPSTALEALQTVERCVTLLSEREQLDENISRQREQAAEYERQASTVFKALGRRAPAPGEFAARVKEAARELEQSKENLVRKEEIEKQSASLQTRIKAAQQQCREHEQRLGDLLREADTPDVDEFRGRGRLFEQRNELLKAIAQNESNLRKISGQADLDILKAELVETSREQLETRRAELALKLSDLESHHNELRDEKARLTNAVETMKTADDIARLRAAEEGVLAELEPRALEWVRYALARLLLQQARRKYEQEQQPKVIRDAGRFFSALTTGRYTRVIAPVGGDTIEVIAANQERKKPEQLSRGTAEQLYLALRFGYIRLHGRSEERLPVVMDEILVNFDPHRARRAAQAILELAQTHQVLFFTCHPETVALFEGRAEEIPHYLLTDGNLVRKQ